MLSTTLWIIGIAFFASGLVVGIVGAYLVLSMRFEEYLGWVLKDADEATCSRGCKDRRTFTQDQQRHLERIGKRAYDEMIPKEAKKVGAPVAADFGALSGVKILTGEEQCEFCGKHDTCMDPVGDSYSCSDFTMPVDPEEAIRRANIEAAENAKSLVDCKKCHLNQGAIKCVHASVMPKECRSYIEVEDPGTSHNQNYDLTGAALSRKLPQHTEVVAPTP